MCQMNVVLVHDGRQDTVMENASVLEVTPEGISVATMFEEPKVLKNAKIKKIDFLGGTVTLIPAEGG